MFFRTYSPQGDGNQVNGLFRRGQGGSVFQNLFPARGRKQSSEWQPISNLAEFVFQNLFPARGRKQLGLTTVVASFISFVFQNLFPARGRKRCFKAVGSGQGSGRFSEPIPRKGTETRNLSGT